MTSRSSGAATEYGPALSAPAPPLAREEAAAGGIERRVIALDGLRGLMTIAVVVSHFFAELPHGIAAFEFGWIAVDMFFVLSGYLIGTLILEKMEHVNFFVVFYVRRACRTLPSYFLVIVLIFFLFDRFGARDWAEAGNLFPLWSYASFSQNFLMVATDSIGPHWLAPTWTLALEEYFYLLAPSLFFFTPRRWLAPILVTVALSAVAVRIAIFGTGAIGEMAGLVLLPGRADVLICGLLAAMALKSKRIPWPSYDRALRLAPLLLVLATLALKLADGATGQGFQIAGPLLISLACAIFIITLVRGAPEAKRFHSKVLRFFGSISYCLYMTHLAVLGMVHGLVLGAKPDLATLEQAAVTVAALPLAVLVGWLMTKLVEEPITAYGRAWKWSERRRIRA